MTLPINIDKSFRKLSFVDLGCLMYLGLVSLDIGNELPIWDRLVENHTAFIADCTVAFFLLLLNILLLKSWVFGECVTRKDFGTLFAKKIPIVLTLIIINQILLLLYSSFFADFLEIYGLGETILYDLPHVTGFTFVLFVIQYVQLDRKAADGQVPGSTRKIIGPALHEPVEEQPDQPASLLVPTPGGERSLNLKEVTYLSFENNLTRIFTRTNEQHVIDRPLKYYEDLLPVKDFFRLNRRVIVNRDHVLKYTRAEKRKLLVYFRQQPAEPVYVSKKKASAFRKWFAGED